LTFLMGGFITTAARLARNNVRPLFLPATGQPPSEMKEVYDLAGTLLSALILNYAAAPFMLLTLQNSFTAWSRLGWYGHIIVFGGLAFFYCGGTGYLKSLQPEGGIASADKKGSVGSGAINGSSTPVDEKTFTVVPSVDEVIPPQK
jgi:lysophospholipid acyltransferase